MKYKTILAASAMALGLGLASPALAQQNQDNDNETTGASGNWSDNDTVVVNDLVDVFLQDNGADTSSDDDQSNDFNESFNDNSAVVANQYLVAYNSNSYLDEVVDLDGEDETDTAVGYNSGSNSVGDSAFAAFAGILNQAWNTGINANTQAATNIAASGTVNFGGGSSGGGDDGGD